MALLHWAGWAAEWVIAGMVVFVVLAAFHAALHWLHDQEW